MGGWANEGADSVLAYLREDRQANEGAESALCLSEVLGLILGKQFLGPNS